MAFQYQVRQGQTPTSIAGQFNLDPADLLKANKGATPFDVGQTIRVPSGGKPLFNPVPGDGGVPPVSGIGVGGGYQGPLSPLPKTDWAISRANRFFGYGQQTAITPPAGSVVQSPANRLASEYNVAGGSAGFKGAAQQGVPRGPLQSPDALLAEATTSGYVPLWVAPSIGALINSKRNAQGLAGWYGPDGMLLPEVAASMGVGESGTSGGEKSKDQYGNTIIPGEGGQYARINAGLGKRGWQVVTKKDSSGNWVRVTERAGRGERSGGYVRGRGGGGGGGGGGGVAKPEEKPQTFGLLNFNFRASTG